MSRVRFEVCPQRRSDQPWKVTRSGKTEDQADRQSEAIAKARALIAAHVAVGGTATLKIKRQDGTIRDERTYPRSSDPRRSKG